MDVSYYISPLKVTPVLEELIMPEDTIKIDGMTYIRLSKKPKGRSIERKLKSMSSEEQILIYK